MSAPALWRASSVAFGASGLVGLWAWWMTDRSSGLVSVLAGASAVLLPAVVSWYGMRGLRYMPHTRHAVIGLLRFGLWWLLKVGLTLALLMLALRFSGSAHALAVLAGLMTALMVFWFVLFRQGGASPAKLVSTDTR